MMTRGRVGRRPEDQYAKVLLDVVKAMLDTGGDKDKAARLHRAILSGDADDTASADDVVDLILLVRLLRIDASGRQDIQAEAERWHAEEFEIELAGFHALPVKVGEFESVHGAADFRESGHVESRQPVVVRPQPLDLAERFGDAVPTRSRW